MGRETKTLRLEDEVDEFLDRKAEEWGVNRSDIVNRSVKVYGAKVASGDWNDPKFEDSIDRKIDEV